MLLFANLGAVQLNYGLRTEHCVEAIDMIGADALVLHVNPLQEALQAEGDRNFRGLLGKIEKLCKELACPVIVKEVGSGISGDVARRLVEAGVKAIDVAGMGGTSFARVEAFRRERPEDVEMALAFSEWGLPTVDALRQVRRVAPRVPAKALALGANLTGFARAVLAAASEGEEPVRRLLEGFAWQLRVAMFCAGAANLTALQSIELAELR